MYDNFFSHSSLEGGQMMSVNHTFKHNAYCKKIIYPVSVLAKLIQEKKKKDNLGGTKRNYSYREIPQKPVTTKM